MILDELLFIFENAEMIPIAGKYLGIVEFDGIKRRITRVAPNVVEKFDVADFVAIEIHRDANQSYIRLGNTQVSSVFDRITSYSDITAMIVTLTSEDKQQVESHQLHVAWLLNEDLEGNSTQSSFISNEGNLYVLIAEGKGVFDFFDEETIQKEGYTERAFGNTTE